ncbi:MAG TPA: hypothetical protein VNZ52_12505 [Candidatus Thermoplasmatota archaeon]|nr:hypothetical protein [Candidatus Thermoplasmatota archaeon]
MCSWMPDDVLQKPVYSGLGEEIGVVVGVEPYPSGFAHKLHVREADPIGTVEVVHTIDERFVKEVTTDRIRLKGPREGFHITRVTSAGAPAAAGFRLRSDR